MLPRMFLKVLFLGHLVQAIYRGEREGEPKQIRNARSLMNAGAEFATPSPAPVSFEMRSNAPPSVPTLEPAPSNVTDWDFPFTVELVDFVVSMSNLTYSETLPKYLSRLLNVKLEKQFETFLSAIIQLVSQSVSRESEFDLFFSGYAMFNSSISESEVQTAQARILLDPEYFRVHLPNVISVAILPAPGQDLPDSASVAAVPSVTEEPSESPPKVGALIGVILASLIVLAMAIFVGRSFYRSRQRLAKCKEEKSIERTLPESPASSKAQMDNEGSPSVISFCRYAEGDECSLSGVSVLYSEAGFENSRHAELSPTPPDDKSVDGASIADSEAGLDSTQLYLKRRQKEKQRQHQESLTMKARDPLCLYDCENEFGYNFVARLNNLESSDDEDLYMTDNDLSVAGSEHPSECKESTNNDLSMLRWHQHKARMIASSAKQLEF